MCENRAACYELLLVITRLYSITISYNLSYIRKRMPITTHKLLALAP